VRPASEKPAAPAVYQINVGVVKLTEQGSHAAIVKQLKDALRERAFNMKDMMANRR